MITINVSQLISAISMLKECILFSVIWSIIKFMIACFGYYLYLRVFCKIFGRVFHIDYANDEYIEHAFFIISMVIVFWSYTYILWTFNVHTMIFS